MWAVNRLSRAATMLAVVLALTVVGNPVEAESGQPTLFASGGGQLTVHGLATGQTATVATGTSRISISPDGHTIASAGESSTAPGAGIRHLRHGGAATVLVSGDSRGSWIPPSWASSSGEFAYDRGFSGGSGEAAPGLYVGDVVENRVIDVSGFDRGWRDTNTLSGFDFSPTSRQVVAATGSDDGTISLYDLEAQTRSEIVVGTDEFTALTIEALAWSPSGGSVAYWQSGLAGSSLRTINIDTGVVTVLHEVTDSHNNTSPRLAWAPDGSAIAYSFIGRGSETQWGVAVVALTGERAEIYSSTDQQAAFGPLAWVTNSELAFAVGHNVLELSRGSQPRTLFRAPEKIISLSFSPNADLAWLPLVAQPRDIDLACPASQVPSGSFTDVGPTNTHSRAINCVAWANVAAGTGDAQYSPSRGVTRAQMATFVARTITSSGGDLPNSPAPAFGDVAGGTHGQAINQLAAVGVVAGTGGGDYSPNRMVTRAQMATFLANAYEYRVGAPLPQARGDYFLDDNGNTHEDRINRVAEAGITGGTGDKQYSPGATVRRDQMASFLARLLDLLAEETD